MKILIFTSSAGNGHNSTAKRLKDRIKKDNPKAIVEIIDAYKSYTNKLNAWIMEGGYFFVCNHMISVYNYFFKQSEKCNYYTRDTCKANKKSYPMMHGMLNKIYEFKPDIIISTYIFCSIALTNLKRVYSIPALTLCMTLDYGISPYWECCAKGLDYMFLTNDNMLEPFKAKGFTDKQLIISGIPIAETFEMDYNKIELRQKLNLDQNLFTIIVMKASFFPIKNKQLIKELNKVNNNLQIVFINGKDTKSKNKLDKLIVKYKFKHRTINLGFINNIVDYMHASDLILGKAGGLSSTEAINSRIPTLIVDKLPQQEIYNKEMLVSNNCAIGVTQNTIAKTIDKLINDKKSYISMQNSCNKLRKLNSIDKFAEIINNAQKSNYKDLELKDNKHQMIRKINRSRLNTIKINKKSSN